MPNALFFLTHDFKPAFRRTLGMAARGRGSKYEVRVLMDDRSIVPDDLPPVEVTPCRRRPSAFDPLGQAHNFYLDLISSDPSALDRFDHFWVFENDVYFHGDIMDFVSLHDQFSTDLLVPEFGHRMPEWMWLHNCRGISPEPCGITAVAYRASSRLMRSTLEYLAAGVESHMEVLLPHICRDRGYTIRQFIPDTVGCCNTFPTPISGLIESEVKSGTKEYIQNKLYHPVKT